MPSTRSTRTDPAPPSRRRRSGLFAGGVVVLALSCAPPDDPTRREEAAEPAVLEVWSEPTPWGTGAAEGEWTYHALGGLIGADFAVEVDLRIDQTTDNDQPVMQLDRVANARNDGDLGGYEAAVSLRIAAGEELRVQLSTRWQEALLWSARGGILQVRPLALVAGQVYRLRASAVGNRVRLWVDDQPVLDHVLRTPPGAGTLALSRKEGATWFGPATVRRLQAPATPAVPPPPDLRLRTWKNARWGFDGDEPIFALGTTPEQAQGYAPHRVDCMAYDVKLVPGYAAQVFLPWYMQNYAGDLFTLSALTSLEVKEQGSRLAFTLHQADESGRSDVAGRTTVTVSYDPQGGAYRYDHHSELVVLPGGSLRVDHPIDVTDPGVYNAAGSASPQGLRWPVTHPVSVYQHEGGALYRFPHNHAGWYPGYGRARWYAARMPYLKPDGGFWAFVGDPVANPVFQLGEPAGRREFDTELCDFAYDLHFRWVPGGEPGGLLGPGTYAVRWNLHNAGGTEGDDLLRRSTFGLPDDLSATWLVYTGGVGYTERFDKVVPQASSFGEYPWGVGALQDPQVGRTDRTSLRLSGPGLASSAAGDGRFTESFDADRSYQVSAWVKGDSLVGEGPGIVFGGQAYYPGLSGTFDWRRIGFVVRPDAPLDVVPLVLHHSGAGTVWFDDFEIRPVNEARAADPGMAMAPRPLAQVGQPRADLTLLVSGESEARDGSTVLDRSGHSHHATLLGGARWVDEPGGRVLDFNGRDARVTVPGHPAVDMGGVVTVSLWIKPGDLQRGYYNTLLSGGYRDQYEEWRVSLVNLGTLRYGLEFALRGQRFRTPAGMLERERWVHLLLAHDGARVRVYLDGDEILDQPLTERWLGQGAFGTLHIGAGAAEGAISEPFTGRLSNLRVAPRAFTAAEAAAEYAAGAFKP